MSGIFGLIDPNGPHESLLRRALKAAAYRGHPEIHVEGPVALGILQADGDPDGLVLGTESILVADARVDALLDGYDALLGPVRGSSAIECVLATDGPIGLDSVAADFAVARFDRREGTLTLARDAFGLRPLYWARSAGRTGFASDPEVLLGFGLAAGEPDEDLLRSWLYERTDTDDRTCWKGIRRVVPGRWVVLHPGGGAYGNRWFRPERHLPDESLTLPDAAALAREAIVAATASRADGRSVALRLSGGRDSSSIAVALAQAGIKATCFTQVLRARGVQSEAALGSTMAASLGHDWMEVPVEPRISPDRLSEAARITGGPLRGVAAPIQLTSHDVARHLGADVLMEGEGGDLLFSAFPIAVADLIRQGRFGLALSAVRNYHRHWSYRYSVTAKIVMRALSPGALIALRERLRKRPPWMIQAPARPARHDRSDVTYLRELLRSSAYTSGEAQERVHRFAGATLAWPLCDMRVVRVSLGLPSRLRVPVPGPKPVLGAALLGSREVDLVKLPLDGFARDLVGNYVRDFPYAFARDSLTAQRGLVRPEGLGEVSDPRWAWDAANVLGVEAWLRRLEEERG